MRTKTLRWLTTIFLISLFSVTLGSCSGGGDDDGGSDNPPGDTNPTTGTISGTVSGTEIVAVNDSGTIVASDDTTGKIPDINGNFPFTLTGIPVGTNIRVYLITASGVYPLYFGAQSTNVFSLSAVADIDLGFVDTTAVPG